MKKLQRALDAFVLVVLMIALVIAVFAPSVVAAPTNIITSSIQAQSSNVLGSTMGLVSQASRNDTTYAVIYTSDLFAGGPTALQSNLSANASSRAGEPLGYTTSLGVITDSGGVSSRETAGVAVMGNFPPNGTALAQDCCGCNNSESNDFAVASEYFIGETLALQSANSVSASAVKAELGPSSPISLTNQFQVLGTGGIGEVHQGVSTQNGLNENGTINLLAQTQFTRDVIAMGDYAIEGSFTWDYLCKPNTQLAPPEDVVPLCPLDSPLPQTGFALF